MAVLEAIDEYCTQHVLIPKNSTIILGLSGGPDSMFLLDYLVSRAELNCLRIIAVHLDHEWRQYSQNDAIFCKQQSEKYGIKFIGQKASELKYAPKFDGSKENLGRMLRRHFFETIRLQEQADLIAVAHQADDQQETFFIRIMRGSSLSGLTCMRPRQGHYIRPLLETSRPDIISYLEGNTIPYLIDPSNESDIYLRNRIRNKLLPLARSIDQRFDKNFAHTLTRLKEADEFLDQLAAQTLELVSTIEHSTVSVDTKKFCSCAPVLQKRMLIHWLITEQVPFTPTDTFLAEIIHFMRQPHGKIHRIHKAWSINKKAGFVKIIKNVNA